MNLDRVVPLIAPLIRRQLDKRQKLRRVQFETVPRAPGRILFLGDSITEWTAWEDWFPDFPTVNRGIAGEAIRDVIGRLDTAIVEPKAISLLIGTNDLHGLGQSSDVAQITEQMRTLVQRIREMTPDAPLLINSVLPRSRHFRDRIVALNHGYRQIAVENDAHYIDLWPSFASPDGHINRILTVDGLHLSTAGYKVWSDILRPYFGKL